MKAHQNGNKKQDNRHDHITALKTALIKIRQKIHVLTNREFELDQ